MVTKNVFGAIVELVNAEVGSVCLTDDYMEMLMKKFVELGFVFEDDEESGSSESQQSASGFVELADDDDIKTSTSFDGNDKGSTAAAVGVFVGRRGRQEKARVDKKAEEVRQGRRDRKRREQRAARRGATETRRTESRKGKQQQQQQRKQHSNPECKEIPQTCGSPTRDSSRLESRVSRLV